MQISTSPARRSRCASRLVVCCILLCAAGSARATAQTTQPAATTQQTQPAATQPATTTQPAPTTQPVDTAPAVATPLPPPKTEAEIAERRELIRKTLEALPAETPPDATTGQKQKFEVAKTLRDTLNLYLQHLDALASNRAKAAALGSQEEIDRRARETEQYRARIEDLNERLASVPGLRRQAQQQRDDLQAEYEQIYSLVDSENKLQSSREKSLAEFSQREREATAALADARNRLDAFFKAPTSQPADMDAKTAEEIRELRIRNLRWQVSLAELRVEQLAVEKSILGLESAAAQSRLPVLRDYAVKLGDYRTQLDEFLSQDEVKRIDRNLAAAKTEHAKAYWQYRRTIAEASQYFASTREGIRGRFRESDKQDIERDISRLRRTYLRLLDGLGRATGGEKKAAFRRLAELIREYNELHRSVTAKLDESSRELDAMLARKDHYADQIEQRDAEFNKALEDITDPEVRTEFQTRQAELTVEHRAALDRLVQSVEEAENEVITRLTEAEKLIGDFLIDLRAVREELFWSYTAARDLHIAAQIHNAVDEFRSPAFVDGLDQAADDASETLNRLSPSYWTGVAFVVVLAVMVGWIGRRRLIALSVQREEDSQQQLEERQLESLPIVTRVAIQGPRMLASALPVLLPGLVLLVAALIDTDLAGRHNFIVACFPLYVTLVALTQGVIVELFEAGKARFRIIPCSKVVGQHYRTWSSLILWISAVLAPVAFLLGYLNIAPVIADAVWSVYSAIILLAVLLFLLRRGTVLRVVGRRYVQRHPRRFNFAVALYPLVVLAIAGLLLLQLIGFDALVQYVLRNLALTVAAVLAAVFLINLIDDLARKKTAKPTDATVSDEDSDDAREIDAVVETYEARELGLLISAAAFLVRWAVILAAIAVIGAAWGLTWFTAGRILAYPINQPAEGQSAITLWRVVGAVFAFVISWKISRGFRATLTTKVYPAYPAIDRGAQATINTLLHYTLVVIGIYISLRLVHLNLGALAVLLGGLGLGLGLGLQPLIVNFVSGMIIFAERHVKVGDIVEVGTSAGEVINVSMRSTVIKTFDGIRLVVPNSEFVTGQVINWTLNDSTIRGKINIGVAYGSDVRKVHDILFDIARSEPRVLPFPEPRVFFMEFGASSLDFMMALWFASPGQRWEGMVAIRYEIDRRFKEEGIEIPFPQRTLSVLPGANFGVHILDKRQSKPVSQDDSPTPD